MATIVFPEDDIFPADDLLPGETWTLEREDSQGRVAIKVPFASDEVAIKVSIGGGTA